ncbi:MAG: hydroxyacid dehydrogenase [Ignavibacteria bacterium]|nr:hydroxyacid dehydrogenase [Ignavibacteria bacterium]
MNLRANIYFADPLLPEDEKYLIKRSYRLFNVNYPSFKRIFRAIAENDSGSFSALVIRSYRRITDADISLLSKTSVKLICTLSSGYDNVDIPACKEAGISVINIPEGNFISAAEHTFSLIMALSKNILDYDHEMRKGEFKSRIKNNFELKNKTIGIIGVGRVGSLVAKFAQAFDMKVLGNDINRQIRKKFRFIRFVSLDTVFKNSDIVTLHVPLDNSTYGMIGDSHFNLIRKKCIFINTSRGEVVNEESLVRALKSGRLFGAGLDVFENEPCVYGKLRNLKNVILTPHVAGKTPESQKRISGMAARNIHRFFKGELKGIV